MRNSATVSDPPRHSRSKAHPRAAITAQICLMFVIAGCTTLVDQTLPTPISTASIPGPSLIPEIKVFPIDPALHEVDAGEKLPSHAELIDQGKSPLPGARPGSEIVLMHFHGKGESRIVLPHQRSGALLWILVGCETEAPLTIQTHNLYGVVMARYDLEPCRAAEGGGGTEDGSSTLVEVWTDPDVAYHLTVISSEMNETSELGSTSGQPHS
ncbi:hypothetical protein [Paeniglutamicibacter sp.]|uniref:hypothetical protein n=1 Tax=Paeniglutamicibacter sp. TaxID=1934391 RepID=UPI003989719B